jgi:hypothetical protein
LQKLFIAKYAMKLLDDDGKMIVVNCSLSRLRVDNRMEVINFALALLQEPTADPAIDDGRFAAARLPFSPTTGAKRKMESIDSSTPPASKLARVSSKEDYSPRETQPGESPSPLQITKVAPNEQGQQQEADDTPYARASNRMFREEENHRNDGSYATVPVGEDNSTSNSEAEAVEVEDAADGTKRVRSKSGTSGCCDVVEPSRVEELNLEPRIRNGNYEDDDDDSREDTSDADVERYVMIW